ncbi:hypothetical protein FACS1894105_11180 [Clostridia bacterium]|nr:hypothetical protein FACS1894105_11180 [Clostridia bacterium]
MFKISNMAVLIILASIFLFSCENSSLMTDTTGEVDTTEEPTEAPTIPWESVDQSMLGIAFTADDFNDEQFDIIIVAGQSNAVGRGIGEVSDEFIPSERILAMEKDLSISYATEFVNENGKRGEFALSFARDYVKAGLLKDNRKLLIIRAADGSAGFSNKRWGPNDDLYPKMIEMVTKALELNPGNSIKALLWHQGETDALDAKEYDYYRDNLSDLINSVRETFNVPDLPFIAGDFVQDWKSVNVEISEPIIRAIKDIIGTIGNARFVETDELLSNGQVNGSEDTIHFSRIAAYQLGTRYFDAYLDIVQHN